MQVRGGLSALVFSKSDGVGVCRDVRAFRGGGLVGLAVLVCAGEGVQLALGVEGGSSARALCSQGGLPSNVRSFTKKRPLRRGVFSSRCLKKAVSALPRLVSPWLGPVVEHLVRPDLAGGWDLLGTGMCCR